KAWPVRSAQCRPPSPPPPASPPASKAAPRRADRRPSPSAGSPARPRNTTEKPSSPSPPRQPRPLPSSTHPPPESEDHDRFSSSSICHANFQSIALPAELVGVAQPGRARVIEGPFLGGQARSLKRQLSLPVSMMSQWWVRRSRSAGVIFGSPNTLGHSPKARLVVTTVNRQAKKGPLSWRIRKVLSGCRHWTSLT